MFIRKGVDYKVSDFAIFRTKYDDPKSQKICQLQCLFQEGNEFRAMVIIYEGADEFRKYFLSLSVDYDLYNEVKNAYSFQYIHVYVINKLPSVSYDTH